MKKKPIDSDTSKVDPESVMREDGEVFVEKNLEAGHEYVQLAAKREDGVAFVSEVFTRFKPVEDVCKASQSTRGGGLGVDKEGSDFESKDSKSLANQAREFGKQFQTQSEILKVLRESLTAAISSLSSVSSNPTDIMIKVAKLEQIAGVYIKFKEQVNICLGICQRLSILKRAIDEKFLAEEGAEDYEGFFKQNQAISQQVAELSQEWRGLGALLNKRKITDLKTQQANRNQRYQAVEFTPSNGSYQLQDEIKVKLVDTVERIKVSVSNLRENKLSALEKDVSGLEQAIGVDHVDVVSPEHKAGIEKEVVDACILEINVLRTTYYHDPPLDETEERQIRELIQLARGMEMQGWQYDESKVRLREQIYTELRSLPQGAENSIREFLGAEFDQRLDFVARLPEKLNKIFELEDRHKEVTEMGLIVRFHSGGRDYSQHKLDSIAEKINKYTDLDRETYRLWRTCSALPSFRGAIGAEEIDRADRVLGLAIKNKLLQQREHTDDSNRWGEQLYDYDGEEFAEYNVLNAWRESGHSGEYPFLPFRSNTDTPCALSKYIQRQPDTVWSKVEEKNPPLVRVVGLVKKHPSDFNDFKIRTDNVDWLDAPDNPVYYEIRENLKQAAVNLLRRDNPAGHFFALAILKKYQGVLDTEIYDLLNKIYVGAETTNLRSEVLQTVVSHSYYADDRNGLDFVLAHMDDFKKEDTVYDLDSLRSHSFNRALIHGGTEADDTVLAKLFKATPERVRMAREVYVTVFQSEEERESKLISTANVDFETLEYLADHQQELSDSIAQVRSWYPEFQCSYSFWRQNDRTGERQPIDANLVLMSSFYILDMQKRLLEYISQHDKLPEGVSDAFCEYSFGDKSKKANVETNLPRCLRMQDDEGFSTELRNYFRNHVNRLAGFSPESLEAFVTFASRIDKASSWEAVEGIFERVRSQKLVDWEKSDDLKAFARFIDEFGTSASLIIFRYYRQLVFDNIIPEFLVKAGIKRAGKEGVNELRKFIRRVRSGLINHDAVVDPENELVAETVATVTSFYTSQWSGSGKTVSGMLSQLEKDKQDGLIKELPKEYVRGTLQVEKLDAEKIKEFNFSEGFNKQYQKMSEAFDLVIRGYDTQKAMAESRDNVLSAVDEELNEFVVKIEKLKADNKPAVAIKGAENKKRDLEVLRQTVRQANTVEDFLAALLNFDKKDNNLTTQAIRKILLVHAHDVNPNYSGGLNLTAVSKPNRDGAQQMMAYVEDLVLAETLPRLNLSDTAQKRIKEIFKFNAFQEEIVRLEDYARKGKEEITCIPSRGPLAEFSGYYGDACWTKKHNIVRDNPEMVGITFVNNFGDETIEKLVGSVLIFERTINGEPIMILRGMNPTENFIRQLNSGSFLEEFIKYIKPIAKKRGIKKIVAPIGVPSTLTNRPSISGAYQEKYGLNNRIKLDAPMDFNGYAFDHVVEIAVID